MLSRGHGSLQQALNASKVCQQAILATTTTFSNSSQKRIFPLKQRETPTHNKKRGVVTDTPFFIVLLES